MFENITFKKCITVATGVWLINWIIGWVIDTLKK